MTQALTLRVLPQDDAALLLREQRMAATVDPDEVRAQLERAARAIGSGGQSGADRVAASRRSQDVEQIRRGLALQPVPGMEKIFGRWLDKGVDTWAIAGFLAGPF